MTVHQQDSACSVLWFDSLISTNFLFIPREISPKRLADESVRRNVESANVSNGSDICLVQRESDVFGPDWPIPSAVCIMNDLQMCGGEFTLEHSLRKINLGTTTYRRESS